MSENQSGNGKMSSVSEASLLVRQVAGPRGAGESIKASIVKAARKLGFNFSRTKDIWYGDARRIDAEEMDQLREQAGRVEAERAVATLVDLRRRLAAAGSDSHRPTIAALDNALRGMGMEMGAVAVREE